MSARRRCALAVEAARLPRPLSVLAVPLRASAVLAPVLAVALALAGPSPAGGQLLPTTTAVPTTAAPTTQPSVPPTVPAPTTAVPIITVATPPPTAAPRPRASTTTSTNPSATTTVPVTTTAAPITTAPPAPAATTAPIDLAAAGEPRYPWLPLLVTMGGFGTALALLAYPGLAERARRPRPPPPPPRRRPVDGPFDQGGPPAPRPARPARPRESRAGREPV